MKAVSHAARRLAERYGVELTRAEMGELTRRLVNGGGVVIDKGRGDAERRLITVKGHEVIVVWDPTACVILSVLPKRRNLPSLKRNGKKGKDGRSKRMGRRPESYGEIETD